jgi:hypothetical protein
MKRFYFLSFILLFPAYIIAQTNSVELRDGSGALISSHSGISAAYNAIAVPLSDSYLIEILPIYNGTAEIFPIILGNKQGADTNRTITVRPAAGNSGEAIITTLLGNSTLIFDDCRYVTVDGRPGGVGTVADLTIENLHNGSGTGGTTTYTIHFRNGAMYNTLKYVNTKGYTENVAGPRVIYYGVSPSNIEGNSYNLLESCTIIGGRSGIGTSGTTGSPNTGNIIRNCRIENFAYAGIWLVGNTASTVIENSTFQQKLGFSTTIVQGILAASSGALGHTVISGNKILDIQMTATGTSTVKGIVVTIPAGGEMTIVNNFISLTLDNLNAGTMYGIHIQGTTDATLNIFFNSVYIDGNHSGGTSGAVTSAAFVKTSSGTGAFFNMKNNIFINKRTGGNAAAYHVGCAMSNIAGVLDVDYNLYLAQGAPNSYSALWAGMVYSDIALYKAAAAPYEANSLFRNVHFMSATDLHLADSSVGDINLAGIPIAGITIDIDGQPRNTSSPYMGADEADIPVPVELSSFAASVNGNSVMLNWSTATELNNYGFDVERRKDEKEWLKAGFVTGSGTSAEGRTYSFSDAGLSNGDYSYRIKQIDYNGTSKYYTLSQTVNISLPLVFELSQNYPNPFNPSTTIKYSVPQAARVSLKLYNVLGTEIAEFVNEMKEPGEFVYEFSTSKVKGLSSGVYFYTLQAGEMVKTKKMIILK